MRTILLNILIGLILFNSYGQTENETKYNFAKEVFNSKKYKMRIYDRFSGQIDSINSNTYRFGNKVLIINGLNDELRKLFNKGIFNPDVIFGKETTKKSKAEIESLSIKQHIFFNLTRNDSLVICCFEQMELLNPNPKTKRFKFWFIRIGIPNPTEYYIELYNDKATKNTELNEFIEGSKMSFYHKGTLIL